MTRTLVAPPEKLVAGSAIALASLLMASVLTVWIRERWSVSLFEAGILALAGAWSVRMMLHPYAIRVVPALVPLSGVVLIGPLQLMTGQTVSRWETWNALLQWSTYGMAFGLGLQIGFSPTVRAPFRRAIFYFGFGLSVISILQFFTSPGKIFWLFDSGYHNDVLGPFVNHDHYAAFIELLLPIALFEALAEPRRTLLATAAAGTMLASVIAGASRAGSFLVIAESALVLFLASRRGLPGAQRALRFLVTFALLFTAIVGVTHLWQRFREADLYRERGRMLIAAAAMTCARPWTGFGLGNFENAYPRYAVFDNGTLVDHAHNDWAEWAAEGGLPFAGCLLLMAACAVRPALRTIWGVGILSLFVHCLVDYPMQKPALALWVFVLMGAVMGREESCGCRSPAL